MLTHDEELQDQNKESQDIESGREEWRTKEDQKTNQQEDAFASLSQEKTPGVYVRTGDRQPHELDMLWSGSKHLIKEERAPIAFFVLGLLLGVVLTSAVFIFFVMPKPDVTAGENNLTTPINETRDIEGSSTESKSKAGGEKNSALPSKTVTPVLRSARTYKVQSGDTLGKIAQKEYGSLQPEMIEKIQRANNLKNPNDIHDNQELIIPPSNY